MASKEVEEEENNNDDDNDSVVGPSASLQAAMTAALQHYEETRTMSNNNDNNHDINNNGGLRTCTANSLSRYWSDEPMDKDERIPPVIWRNFLSDDEISKCLLEASKIHNSDGNNDNDNDSNVVDGHHAVTYLHVGRRFQRDQPALMAKILRGMYSFQESPQSSRREPQPPLHVRCIEVHTYMTGGGLIQPLHRDNGSTLTMSVLLSTPHKDFGGGEFVTYSDDVPPDDDDDDDDSNADYVKEEEGGGDSSSSPRPSSSTARMIVHDMKRSDAIVFASEKLHNVATVQHGMRQALVIELWRQGENQRDRFE